MQSIDSPNAMLDSAIKSGNIKKIESLLEALSPGQRKLAEQALQKLNTNAEKWIADYCKGSVNRKFPSQFRDKTLSKILQQAKKGDKDAKTAWKLLNDLRDKFRK